MRILFVENNPTTSVMVEEMLRVKGHKVIPFMTAEGVLTYLERIKPDLILADFLLGGNMNGVDMIRTLRTMNYQKPIVMMAAKPREIRAAEEMMQWGCHVTYIEKPVCSSALLRLIKSYEISGCS